MKVLLCAVSITLLLIGCSTEVEHLRYDDTGVSASGGVKLLRDAPREGEYQSLGERSWSFYRPGWREPELGDIWPDLSARIRGAGGDACFVKYQHVSTWTARSIDVTCDVLRLNALGLRPTVGTPASIAAPAKVEATGRFQYSVDRLFKDGFCKPAQPARFVSSGAGIETYSDICHDGDTSFARCEFGQCKVLH